MMAPLFFPKGPIGHDIIRYFASLLRVVGMEDKGWDPTLNRVQSWKIYSLMQIKLPEDRFPAPDRTVCRLSPIFYNHIVEMDAPYEVLANFFASRFSSSATNRRSSSRWPRAS